MDTRAGRGVVPAGKAHAGRRVCGAVRDVLTAGATALLLVFSGSGTRAVAEPGLPQPPDRSESPDAPSLPQGQIPDLGRPTEAGDEVPTFDYDAYFPGVWTFEWRVPDSPLGPGGLLTGAETFAPGRDGRHYRATIEAEGPEGPFTTESTIIYLAGQRAFVRQDTDSRGFAMLRAGRIGGDLGGFYTIHYETAPFDDQGAFHLVHATDPEAIADRLLPQPEPSAALGVRRIRLIGTLDEFGVARHVDYKVWAKGLLIEDETELRLNVVSLTPLSPDCELRRR